MSNKKMTLPCGHNFATCYIDMCKQQRLRPLSIICVTLPYSLDFTTDRVKIDDWGPILNALSMDRSLKSVSVRSRYQCRKPLDNINSRDKIQRLCKPPIVLTRYLMEWLSHSVAQCMRNSPALTCLQLEGVPLPADCLAALCVGLAGTQSLQHLSLKRCYIGDNCCAMICKTIANVQSIKSLNLSECDLSSNCGSAVASALSRQKLLLYHESWKNSLRYREPNFETMGGLRRLTLNGNPHLGNSAVGQIIDAIQDSLWLKAFDLQNCGLTDIIGNKIIELLDNNKVLQVIDVRLNINLNETIVQDIFNRLERNNIGCYSEYRFLNIIQKDRRSVPENTKKSISNYNNAKNVICPNSEIIKNTKNGYPLNSPTLINTTSIVGKKTKTRLSLPLSIQARKSNQKMPITQGKTFKIPLHLDLQSNPQLVVENLWQLRQVQMNALQKDPKMNEGCQTDEIEQTITIAPIVNLNDILLQLSDAKKEREKLLMATQSMERELREERERREAGETKLWSMQQNLKDLESVLKAKELESRGCVLMSQQSLDEISMTFEQLLKALEDLSRKPSVTWCADEEKSRADIRQRIAMLIRQTKSEKLYREFNETQSTTKYSKSENDINNLSSIISSIQLERNIGDHPDSSPIIALDNDNCTKHEKLKSKSSPCERARAIFAQIINSNVILNLNPHVS